jgi:hypothetical protein
MAEHARGRSDALVALDSENERRPLLEQSRAESSPIPSTNPSYASSFLDEVAEGIQARDREAFRREVDRYVGFVFAILSWYARPFCWMFLCADQV